MFAEFPGASQDTKATLAAASKRLVNHAETLVESKVASGRPTDGRCHSGRDATLALNDRRRVLCEQ